MKLTYEEKCEIYRKWKYEGYGCTTLGRLYGIVKTNANYIIRLADKHGVEIQIQGNENNINAFLKDILNNNYRFIKIFNYSIKKIPLIEEECDFRVEY